MAKRIFPTAVKLGEQPYTGLFDDRLLPGRELAEWLIVYSMNRDSDAVQTINFDTMRAQFTECEVLNFGHWACGWVEYLIIPPGGAEEELAHKLHEKMEEYPILDEERLCHCERCGEHFDAEARNDGYCGDWCEEQAVLDGVENCAHCGELCFREHHGVHGVYCSEECLDAAEPSDPWGDDNA